jgi:hypothetical protein
MKVFIKIALLIYPILAHLIPDYSNIKTIDVRNYEKWNKLFPPNTPLREERLTGLVTSCVETAFKNTWLKES